MTARLAMVMLAALLPLGCRVPMPVFPDGCDTRLGAWWGDGVAVCSHAGRLSVIEPRTGRVVRTVAAREPVLATSDGANVAWIDARGALHARTSSGGRWSQRLDATPVSALSWRDAGARLLAGTDAFDGPTGARLPR